MKKVIIILVLLQGFFLFAETERSSIEISYLRAQNVINNRELTTWINGLREYYSFYGIKLSEVQSLDASTIFTVELNALKENLNDCKIYVKTGGFSEEGRIHDNYVGVLTEITDCPVPIPAVTGSN